HSGSFNQGWCGEADCNDSVSKTLVRELQRSVLSSCVSRWCLFAQGPVRWRLTLLYSLLAYRYETISPGSRFFQDWLVRGGSLFQRHSRLGSIGIHRRVRRSGGLK